MRCACTRSARPWCTTAGVRNQAAVIVVVVVPAEEVVPERPAICQGPKAFGKRWAVLQGLELGFGKRVVVGDVGATVRLRDAEIGEEQGDRLARHGRATVRMHREGARLDPLLCAGCGDERSASAALARGASIQPTT